MTDTGRVALGDLEIANDRPLTLIAGPCALESRQHALEMSEAIQEITTRLGSGVYVGSNSTLVAPVEVAAGGFVAAGSTVTKAVGEDELAVSRARQRNISGWQRPGTREQEN